MITHVNAVKGGRPGRDNWRPDYTLLPERAHLELFLPLHWARLARGGTAFVALPLNDRWDRP